jgi:hypothetical protein
MSKLIDNYILVPKSAVREDYKEPQSNVTTGTLSTVVSQSTSSSSSTASMMISSPSIRTIKPKLDKLSTIIYVPWSPVFTTSVKACSTKIDVTSDAEFQALTNLYDEYRFDSVKLTHFYTNGDAAIAQMLGLGALAVDINSDGATPTILLGLLRMQHKKLIEWGNPKPDVLSAPLSLQSNASGQYPAWQKCSLSSYFWPGGVYISANGFPASNHTLTCLLEVKVSFRTKQ